MSQKRTLKLSFSGNPKKECGVDEAGVGPLVGPIAAAAVVWTHSEREGIYDSKKIKNPKRREELAEYIKNNSDDYAIAFVDEDTVDEINPLEARILAMHRAIAALKKRPKLILVDGNRFHPYEGIEHKLIVRGDDEYTSIAAASILAKVERDKFLRELHEEYPMYGWDTNQGYGTSQHIQAIKKHGLTPYHRKTFCQKILSKAKSEKGQ